MVPKPLRHLTLLSALALSATLVTGTTVTGAGPHAGDKSPQRIVPRLEVEIITLVHAHSTFLFIYLSLLVGLGAGLFAVYAPRSIMRRLLVLVLLVMAQGLLGAVQFFTGCPPCWSPFTSPVRRPAPRPPPRYGRRCDSGPSPRRSRADSTSTAKARCCSSRVRSSS